MATINTGVTASAISHADGLLQLKGVGPKVAEKLSKLGLNTIQDVLFHLPYRYEDRTRVVPIGALRQAQSALIEGVVDYSDISFTRSGKHRRVLLVHLSDGTGSILLRFFYFNKQQQDSLTTGAKLRCFGDVRFGKSSLEIVHPEYTLITEHTDDAQEDSLTPVYHTTDGVSQILLRRVSTQCLSRLSNSLLLPDYLPKNFIRQEVKCSLADALQYVHRPPAGADVNLLTKVGHASQIRLVFEELLAHHLSLQIIRAKNQQHATVKLICDNRLISRFLKTLPFELTKAQKKVSQEILTDLQSGVPMMRLIQGDVGSGKTVVAAMACLTTVESGMQAAIMAPTEILAEQHFQNFKKWFEKLGIKIVWLTGQLKGKKRQLVLDQLKSGEAQITIGTHALFQDDVVFKKLALAITDEQHRFGVEQRMALARKANFSEAIKDERSQLAHQLIMTATPIPRSLAMTAYADLDYSVIDELPPGRKPVSTVVLPEERRGDVLRRIHKACAQGKQAYWVCTLVEESETLQCQAAEDTAEALSQALSGITVGLVHGRLKAEEKENVMQRFKSGEIQLLVATTVIEVGVDVPNASLMIIENAERLGLSQLHQLRGRVGRGEEASHCALMFKSPLSQNGKQRLAIMRETNSGFEIAQKDLQIRGPGEVLGTKQTGLVQFKIADIVRDEYLLAEVKEVAVKLSRECPENVLNIINRWIGKAQHFVNIG